MVLRLGATLIPMGEDYPMDHDFFVKVLSNFKFLLLSVAVREQFFYSSSVSLFFFSLPQSFSLQSVVFVREFIFAVLR